MPGIYDGSWRLLWHRIRVHLDAKAQRRAELIVMRGMDRNWHPEKLRRLLKRLLEKAPTAAALSERRSSLRDHANDQSLSRANGRGSAGTVPRVHAAKTPAVRAEGQRCHRRDSSRSFPCVSAQHSPRGGQ
jgi:hypothetical protein